MLHWVRGHFPEEAMLFTWDRYHAVTDRWLRQTRRRPDPMREFLGSIDVMIGIAGAAFAACIIAIALG